MSSKYIPVRCPDCEETNFILRDEWEELMEADEFYECENCGTQIDLHREYERFKRRIEQEGE